MNDRIEAMRVLSAGNTIMMLILGAILGLQASLGSRLLRLGSRIMSHHPRPILPQARGTRILAPRSRRCFPY